MVKAEYQMSKSKKKGRKRKQPQESLGNNSQVWRAAVCY